MNADVDGAVWEAAHRSVFAGTHYDWFWLVQAYVYRNTNRIMHSTLTHFVDEFVKDDPPHPALQDFLRAVYSDATSRRR